MSQSLAIILLTCSILSWTVAIETIKRIKNGERRRLDIADFLALIILLAVYVTYGWRGAVALIVVSLASIWFAYLRVAWD